MSKTISTRGGKTTISATTTSGFLATLPTFALPPSDVIVNDITSAIYLPFTPSGTTVTINPTGENAITLTNATAGTGYLCVGNPMSNAHFVAATARRKSGTTGDIVAQTVIFSVNSVEIGRFNVEAATGPANPVCGYFAFLHLAGDSRVNLDTYNMSVSVTAADTDIEIVLWVAGFQN